MYSHKYMLHGKLLLYSNIKIAADAGTVQMLVKFCVVTFTETIIFVILSYFFFTDGFRDCKIREIEDLEIRSL